MSYSVVKNKETLERALSVCRGVYQRNLVLGRESLSGATLTGIAKTFSGRYKTSAENLITRLNENGILAYETRGKNNKRILNIE